MLTIFEVILGSLAFVYTGSVVAWYARLEKLVRF